MSRVVLASSYDTASNTVAYPVQRDSWRVLHPLALPSQYINSRCLSKVSASHAVVLLCDRGFGEDILFDWRLAKNIHIKSAGVFTMQTT